MVSQSHSLFRWIQAKSYLEKAMKMDPGYLEAVYTMAEILKQQQQPDKAIEL